MIGNRNFPNNGFEQVDRLSKLIFILTNDPLHMFKKILEYVVPKITVFFPPDVTSLRTSRIFRHFVIRKTIVNRECPKATYKIVI